MELRRELYFSLDLLIVGGERHLGELNAQVVLARCFCLVLILHVRMDVSVEKLRVVLVSQLKSHALVWSPALLN